MEPRKLAYKNSTISYYRFGSGPAVVVCFHGYGEDATSYEFLAKYAGNQFTFYSVDLPFHGKTEWNEGLNFTATDLRGIVEGIFIKEDSRLTTNDSRLSLLGFSLGGRIALGLYQIMPEKIDRLVLMAPDGLKVNFWYWLTTQTWMGNKFFSFTMKHPGWFFGFLKILNKLGLVNASIFKFVNYYIGNKEARLILYQRWTCLRKIKPHLKEIKSQVRKKETKARLLYGKHDRIILSSVGEKFKKGIEGQCSVTVINAGHQVLHEKHIEEILPALQD